MNDHIDSMEYAFRSAPEFEAGTIVPNTTYRVVFEDDLRHEQKVRDLIAKWQPRLGLQAWDIRYAAEPMPDKGNEDLTACVYKHISSKTAQIFMLQDTPDRDLEQYVVHELLHIAFTDYEHLAMSCAGMGKAGATVLMDHLDALAERLIDDMVLALTGTRATPHNVRNDKKFSAFR